MNQGSEIQSLKQELIKLKEEKDFVWNLWKRLQLSSPDMTKAVNLVVEREKEKHENNICDLTKQIELKSERIEKLELNLKEKDVEIEILNNCKEEIFSRNRMLETQCLDLSDKADKLAKTVDCKYDKNSSLEMVKSYEKERRDLLLMISDLQNQIMNLTEEKALIRLELEKSVAEERRKVEEANRTIEELRDELREVEDNNEIQADTIHLLRKQLSENRRMAKKENLYWSDDNIDTESSKNSKLESGALSQRSGSQNDVTDCKQDEEVPMPVLDLNYKVDRLSIYMKQLEKNMLSGQNKKLPFNRIKKNSKTEIDKSEVKRKVTFLSQKLVKVESELIEERKNAEINKDLLDKANARVKSTQLTIKQLRKQLENSKEVENQQKLNTCRFREEMERHKDQVEELKHEIERYRRDSISDANRIQDLLLKLEEARKDFARRSNEIDHKSIGERDHLRKLVEQLQLEKCTLETNLEAVHCKLNELENSWMSVISDRDKEVKISKLQQKPKRSRKIQKSKIKDMKTILEHFGGSQINGQNKTGTEGDIVIDAEDQQTAEDSEGVTYGCEEEMLLSDYDQKLTGRSSRSSVGEKIANIAKINKYAEYPSKGTLKPPTERQKAEIIVQMQTELEAEQKENRKLKGRVQSLQQQVRSMGLEKEEFKMKLQNTEQQLPGLYSELLQAKSKSKKLQSTLKSHTSQMQLMLEEKNKLCNNDSNKLNNYVKCTEVLSNVSSADREDYEINNMAATVSDNRLQTAPLNQASVCRNLKQEIIRKDIDLKAMQSKLSRLERECANKRKINEDLRNKLNGFNDYQDREKVDLSAKDKRIKELEENNHRLKIQLDSLNTRLGVVMDERKKSETQLKTLNEKMEVAENKITEFKQVKQILESQVMRSNKETEERVANAVKQSEVSLDKATAQIQKLKSLVAKYEYLILNLARTVSDKAGEIRRLIEVSHNPRSQDFPKLTIENTDDDPAVEIGRSKAAELLNLSNSELDCLLSGSNLKEYSQYNNSNMNKTTKGRNNNTNQIISEIVSTCKKAFKKENFDEEIHSLLADQFNDVLDLMTPGFSDSGCNST